MKKTLFCAIVGTTLCIASPLLFAASSANNSFTLADGAPASGAVSLPDPALTSSSGDVGDPNDATVAAAAAQSSTDDANSNDVIPPVTPFVGGVPAATTPSPATPTASTASTGASTDNAAATPPALAAFGNTSNGRSAFTHMLRNLMPLDPNQIITLRNMFDSSQRAVAQYPGVPPKPTSSSTIVNMSPGATPPVIRLRAGYVTSLVFLDSTGQSWPVVGYDLGNPKAFNIQPSAPDGKSDTLIIQALDRYEQGNLAVMLKGENTPVMLTLMPGQRAVDYRVDLRVPGLGPNALVAMNGLPQSESPSLLDFLDGTPPMSAKLLTVTGAPAQAWSYQGYLFLRARLTILSPGWLATMSSPDGTHVYELAKTPVILASQRGEMVQLSIKGL